MYHVSAHGVDERMINVHYYYYYLRERTEDSELYCSRIKILGSCLFLQSVPANLLVSGLHIKQ